MTSVVELTARIDRPHLGFVGCSLNADAARNWFYLRETVDVQITVYDGDDLFDLTGTTAAHLMAKPADDYAGDVLFQSTNLQSTASELLNGVLVFEDVDLNTVELIAELGTDLTKTIAISAVDISSGVEDRIFVQGNVNVLSDVVRGDEDDPTYAYSLKHNTTATTDPTATDDSSEGYAIGSVWVNKTLGKIFVLQDATEGAAVWVEGWMTGCSGVQGFQGFQGYQGFRGFQGVQGPQGFQGFQGFQGVQGPQGFQGFQGFQGVQGPQGLQGVQGPQGYQGFQGIQGLEPSSDVISWTDVDGPTILIDDGDSPYTVSATAYQMVRMDGSSAAVTATAPAAASVPGRIFMFKAVDSSNTLTVAASGAELIDGAASVTITYPDCLHIRSFGTGYDIV